MKLTKHTKEMGTAIVLVISILATLMVIVGVALEYTTNIGRNVQRSNTLESAIAIADGCLEHNFAQWRKVCKNPLSPKPTSNDLNTLPLPTSAQFPAIANFAATRSNYDINSATTVQQCKVVAADPELVEMGTDIVPTQGIGNGTVSYNYLATAYVTLPVLGPRKNVVVGVQRVFQELQDSPFNYAIYYVDPLEIHPGPPLNVTGWVHTNSDLYTAHNTLNFSEKATYKGTWDVDFRPGDTSHTGETPAAPTGVRPSLDSNAPPPLNIDDTTFDPSDPNNTGFHELIEPPVPSASPDPFLNSRYYDQASVILEIGASGTPLIKRGNGDGTATLLTSSSTGTDLQLFNMFNAAGAITTNESIQDNREQAPIRITTVDVSRIITNNATAVNGVKWSAGSAFNGTVYVNDKRATPGGVGVKCGIRVKNATLIPDGGLTVASPNPVYVQGDFNTGLNPPSNRGDPDTPQGTLSDGSAYTRQPCSVIADAVNILSNRWLDTLSGTTPPASPTTVNSAIVSGVVTSGSGFVYTGGAENFPRFLENWGGQDFTYYGSMIQLYDSKQSIGVWGHQNVYSPPNRKWFFDKNFKLKVPPGGAAFATYTYIKGRWSLVQ